MSRADFQNNMGSKLSDKRTGFPNILQHDSVLKPSDCGGPLVELDGKAVGINIARAGRVESYAIPSDTVLALLPDLKSGKLAPKPPAPEPTVDEEKIARLEAALKSAEQKVTEVEKESVRAKALVKQAEEAKELSNGDADATAVHRRAAKYAASVEKQLSEARQSVEKARAELKSAQDRLKKSTDKK